MRTIDPGDSIAPLAWSPLAASASSDGNVHTDTHALGETIASMAAGIHAATYQLLVLLRDFYARDGWNNDFLSCAHWLHWRTGIICFGKLVSVLLATRSRRT